MWINSTLYIMPIHITFSHLAFLSHMFCLKVFTVVFFIFLHFALIYNSVAETEFILFFLLSPINKLLTIYFLKVLMKSYF